jgi:hypothetical protein
MTRMFEKIDIENDEYEAWDSAARPLRMSVKQTQDWLDLEPADHSEPEQLRNAIRAFARIQNVEHCDQFDGLDDFSKLLEAVTLSIQRKRESESWWQKLRRRF